MLRRNPGPGSPAPVPTRLSIFSSLILLDNNGYGTATRGDPALLAAQRPLIAVTAVDDGGGWFHLGSYPSLYDVILIPTGPTLNSDNFHLLHSP